MTVCAVSKAVLNTERFVYGKFSLWTLVCSEISNSPMMS